ncbi:unnamed protein product [Heligmosomoides polygyrus]|uniref:SWIM-type domain-containing protein n=1 Tax=Heligmosomoides polygyrus TaxID=6339 RepID=A0A183GIS7_HELPZ|nr:unnamed protein product [Heligmosomoides polygyrus]
MAIVEENFRRLENDYDVDDEMHFLHLQFKCDGQPFPAVEGRLGFPLTGYRVSQRTTAKDLLPKVPKPAADERLECVLDVARVLALWWGSGSVSVKVKKIRDKNCLAINPKSVAVAYAFFKSRCSHVAAMAGLVPQGA